MTATQHIRLEPEGTLPSKEILFKRLTSISASSEIEGVTMDDETMDDFRRFIDEGWSPMRRLDYLRKKFSVK